MIIILSAALLAGCGGQAVPPGAIAVVGGRTVPRAALDAELAKARRAYAVRGQAFPAAGTAAYSRLEDGAVRLLVERTQLEVEAGRRGIAVRPAQVEARLRRLKRQDFGGSPARYREQLRRTGLTDADIRTAIRYALLAAAVPAGSPRRVPVTYAPGFTPPDGG